jgi:hypothetical protein
MDVGKRTFLTLPGIELDLSVVQPVESRYTDYASPTFCQRDSMSKFCNYARYGYSADHSGRAV